MLSFWKCKAYFIISFDGHTLNEKAFKVKMLKKKKRTIKHRTKKQLGIKMWNDLSLMFKPPHPNQLCATIDFVLASGKCRRAENVSETYF